MSTFTKVKDKGIQMVCVLQPSHCTRSSACTIFHNYRVREWLNDPRRGNHGENVPINTWYWQGSRGTFSGWYESGGFTSDNQASSKEVNVNLNLLALIFWFLFFILQDHVYRHRHSSELPLLIQSCFCCICHILRESYTLVLLPLTRLPKLYPSLHPLAVTDC